MTVSGRSTRLVLLVALALGAACRTGRPAGESVSPLSAPTPEAAMQQLKDRRDDFDGMRSLMRVRATTKEKTQSFRAQLIVHDRRRMELVAYTPVGTTALNLRADGDRVTSDPPVAPEAFQFLRAAGLTPAETAMLILGLPPRDDLRYEVTSTGLQRAEIGDVVVTFDPPSFPATRVVIARGNDRVEIEHLEVVH
jgi:hypothetical protein